MTQIGIVYFSGGGTTAGLADAVERGVRLAGANPLVFRLQGADFTEGRWQNEDICKTLDTCDGIIFGSPTYMGSVSGQLKSFFDAMAPRWFTQAWKDKVASGFTASSLAAGDKYAALMAMTTFAMQMGMIWCGTGTSLADQLNPNGFYFGAGATASSPDQLSDIDLSTGEHLGQRIAELAEQLQAR